MNLHAGNSVLAVAEHPESGHPLVESECGVLEDSSDLERELLIASTAEPQFPRLDEVVLRVAATRANNVAIRPAKILRVIERAVRIGEVNDGLL